MRTRPILAFCLLILVVAINCQDTANPDSDIKANKVTLLLRYIKEKSAQTVNQIDNPELNNASLDHLSEKELLDEICSRFRFKRTCKNAVAYLSTVSPTKLNEIVEAVRSKSTDEDARKLLRHKLIEYGVNKAEETGLDDTINSLVDLFAKRSVYGFAATKLMDTVSTFVS